MLVKIHLKTACGCERSYFEHHMPQQILRVPLRVTDTAFGPHYADPIGASYSTRDFRITTVKHLSNIRKDLWYEEVVHG